MLRAEALELDVEPCQTLAELESLGRIPLDGDVRSLIVDQIRRRQLRELPGRRERRVVGDAQQPGAERSLAAEAIQPVECAQERVLRDVLGVVIARSGSADTAT